jgi:UDP-hydrolysing UDP-N-acetyl-D-glucosamine 2-epimerase
LSAVKAHPYLELQLIVGASAMLYRFGNVREVIETDGFQPTATLYTIVEGETPTTMAKSTGLAVIELATLLENLKPDVVLTVADRFETIATAIAASYMNIAVAHTQGGVVTGSIVEWVRHAVTKLAHIHFPATELAAQNVVRMGEDPQTVHMTGCPSIDVIADISLDLPEDMFARYKGVGPDIDPRKPFLVVLQHPVTTEYGRGMAQINETIAAITEIKMPTVWLWPNVDAGSDDISKGLRMFRDRNPQAQIHFFRNFAPPDYARLINNAACLVGNSSSGLREGAFLGVPVVNVGTRQSGRECGPNVVHVGYDRQEIKAAALKQVKHGRYERSALFGDGQAGQRIADILASAKFQIQKQLHYR